MTKEIEMKPYGIHIATALVMLLGTTTAHADVNAWGTPDDALKCSTELGSPDKSISIWIMFKDNTVVTPPNATADCKAEVDKRAVVCTSDPTMADSLKDTNK